MRVEKPISLKLLAMEQNLSDPSLSLSHTSEEEILEYSPHYKSEEGDVFLCNVHTIFS